MFAGDKKTWFLKKILSNIFHTPSSRKPWEMVVQFWLIIFRKSHWLFWDINAISAKALRLGIVEQIICILNTEVYNAKSTDNSFVRTLYICKLFVTKIDFEKTIKWKN